jgi:hypothetical protein
LVSALKEIGAKVAILMIVERGVYRVLIVVRRRKATDVGQVRYSREELVLAPVDTAILGDVDQAVISADVEQAFEPG